MSGGIGSLPAGAGYTLSLTATNATHRLTECRGETTFDVTAGVSTPVDVHMICLEEPPPAVPLSPVAMLALGAALAAAGTTAKRRRR